MSIKEKLAQYINENLENIEIICKKDMSDRDRMIFVVNKDA